MLTYVLGKQFPQGTYLIHVRGVEVVRLILRAMRIALVKLRSHIRVSHMDRLLLVQHPPQLEAAGSVDETLQQSANATPS